MAKFCANCGAKMEDTDRVCGQCGTPVAAPEVTEEVKQEASKLSLPKDKVNKIVVLCGIGVAALIVLVILINILSAFTGYRGTLNKAVKALKNENVEALAGITSEIYEVKNSYYSSSFDVEDGIEREVKYQLDSFENDLKAEVKSISYEIEKDDVTVISKRRMENMKEKLEESYNMDTSSIKKIISVRIKLNVKGTNGKKKTYRSDDMYLIKEAGGWKIYRGDLAY